MLVDEPKLADIHAQKLEYYMTLKKNFEFLEKSISFRNAFLFGSEAWDSGCPDFPLL